MLVFLIDEVYCALKRGKLKRFMRTSPMGIVLSLLLNLESCCSGSSIYIYISVHTVECFVYVTEYVIL